MSASVLRLATSGSALGLWRAKRVAALLRASGLTTTSDARIVTCAPGQGAVGRIRAAVLSGEADVAVHRADELPWAEHEGLRMLAIPLRGDPREVLCASGVPLSGLPPGARVGTFGSRSGLQLSQLRSDLVVVALDGDVLSALRRLDDDLAAVVVSRAAVVALDQEERITKIFSSVQFVPAAGQAALALEARAADQETGSSLLSLNDAASRLCVLTERTVARRLAAWPPANVGASCALEYGFVSVTAVLAPGVGSLLLRAVRSGPAANARQIAEAVADELVLLHEINGDEDADFTAGEPSEAAHPARGLQTR